MKNIDGGFFVVTVGFWFGRFFSDRVSQCSPGWPQTFSPASVFKGLGLQMCTITPGSSLMLIFSYLEN
jgi:hypothetical protein